MELTKEDTLKQFEDSENKTQANKQNLNESKQTTKEHVTDTKMLARNDKAHSFQSLGSMTDHHWKGTKIFRSKSVCKISLIFVLTMTLFL